jgi:hypothetical protein
MFYEYKKRSRQKSREFAIDFIQFRALVSSPCSYCGQDPTLRRLFGSEYLANGIDRKDVKIGYTLENCVTCCEQCNYMRLDYDIGEFLEHAERITRWQWKKPS